MQINTEQFGNALKAALQFRSDDELRMAAGSGISRSYYVKFSGRIFPLKTILRLAYRREDITWDRPQSGQAARVLRSDFQILHITKSTEKRRLERQRKNAERWERDPRYRTDVLDLYGSTCAVSGCTVLDAIDAAHVLGVGKHGEDKAENGIVFRADLHRLFDAEPPQMAIDPRSMTVHFSRECTGHFSAYEGREVKIPQGGPPSKAFSSHWKTFVKAHNA
ncbi:HNH endonuclease [Sphingomonadaceae bacterium OTU29LAMAA1]|nr:HNH endonuclease [Sphingomonadaceae bacterium OTU29LAMAA1]